MKSSLVVVTIALLSSLTLVAQEERAVVTGTVTDASRSPLSGATVEISSSATGFDRTIKTNDSGYYRFPGLQVGVYSLSISQPGFRTTEFKTFELVVGQTRTFDAQLQIAAASQEVLVESDLPPLNQETATVGGVLQGREVESLPINGRAWTALMALVPGAIDSGGGTQKSIRFAGRGNDDNNFRFDGLDATGISNQAPNASYRLQISTEAIAEFKVDTVLYDASIGGTNGGQVEVISKSGSNSLHGSAFEFIRNDKISARGPFDPSTLPPLRLNQYGGSVGGAIIKNRTFFFAAYEGLRQRVGTTLIGTVPSDAYRAQVLATSPVLAPIINAYPIGNRPVTATQSQYVHSASLAADEDSGLIRIDHRFSDSTNFYARYNLDQVQLSTPSGALLDKTLVAAAPMNGVVSLSHVFSPNLFNVLELGVNRIHALTTTDSYLYDTSKLNASVAVPSFTKLNQRGNAVRSPTTYTAKDDFTYIRGAHTIKAGVEIKRVLYNYSQVSENGLIYATLAGFTANQLDQVNLIGGVPVHGLDKTEYFGYVQDSWKATPNLVLNLGLRYEFFNVFHEEHGRSIGFDPPTCGPNFCPPGGDFTNPIHDNFEPRVSLAWSPSLAGHKLVVRSGFGLYKGEGQLGDLNAPSDNYTTRFTLNSASFPNLSFPADSFYALGAATAITPRSLDRNRRDPSVEEWGLQLETALPVGFVLDTGYIGYHGYHQFTRFYINRINPATGTRPYPGFGPIDRKQTDGNNHFNGWQTSLRRQFKSGVSFSANFLWSHAINDGGNGGGEADYYQNTDCRTCDVASSDFDVRKVFSSNTVYELPFGRGKRFLNGGGLPNAVLGGWSFSGIGTYRSGNPINVTIVRPASALPDQLSVQNGSTFQRPNYVGGVSVIPANQSITNWINPAAFTIPANGVYGNAGRNLVRGPNFWQADMSLVKNVRITERLSADFRAEAFNVFNRAQFGDPSGNFSDPFNFGRITTTVNNGSATGSGTPREFQFSLRLQF